MSTAGTCAVLLLAAVTPGCATAGGPASSAPSTSAPSTSAAASSAPSWADWDEPDGYGFTVESSCGEHNFLGVYRVTVRGGEVVAADHDDRSTGETVALEPGELQEVPTLGDMLDEARSATGDPEAGGVVVETDPAEGNPREVSVDRVARGVDDESCYVVTDYEPVA